MKKSRALKIARSGSILAGVFSALTLVPTLSVRADPNLNCDAYAKAAVAEQQQNIQLQCGFGGLVWRDDYQAHFDWCQSAGVGITDISGADQFRVNALAQCQQTKNQVAGACGFFAVAMGPLYNEYNEACAGQPDFLVIINTPQQDKDRCAANGADANWINNTVSQMQGKIGRCNFRVTNPNYKPHN